MQRPKVNGTLRSIVMLAIAYLLLVIFSLVGGELLGIEAVGQSVKTFALTSSAIFGVIGLVIMTVFDAA